MTLATMVNSDVRNKLDDLTHRLMMSHPLRLIERVKGSLHVAHPWPERALALQLLDDAWKMVHKEQEAA